MASIEYIDFSRWREPLHADSEEWQIDTAAETIEKFPQIFWRDGLDWAEANQWAIQKASGDDPKLETVKSLMKHLNAYARWLEEKKLDWRHFPIKTSERSITRFRGSLIEKINEGQLALTTARNRMAALAGSYSSKISRSFVTGMAPLATVYSCNLPRSLAEIADRLFARASQRCGTRVTQHGARVRILDGLLPPDRLGLRHMRWRPVQRLLFASDFIGDGRSTPAMTVWAPCWVTFYREQALVPLVRQRLLACANRSCSKLLSALHVRHLPAIRL